MLSITSQDSEDPDPIDRQKLVCAAAYLTNKHSIHDGLTETPIFNMEHPVAFQTLLESMNNKEDILTQGQMLKAPDAAEFKKAQEPELQGLLDLEVFEYVRRHTKPEKSKILKYGHTVVNGHQMAHFLNTKHVSAPTDPNKSKAKTMTKHMLP